MTNTEEGESNLGGGGGRRRGPGDIGGLLRRARGLFSSCYFVHVPWSHLIMWFYYCCRHSSSSSTVISFTFSLIFWVSSVFLGIAPGKYIRENKLNKEEWKMYLYIYTQNANTQGTRGSLVQFSVNWEMLRCPFYNTSHFNFFFCFVLTCSFQYI